ncbi:CRISPR-associated helicase/endonuclease Cas3 [Caldicellulosiruptor morganii]|uniref:CRISPR-associated helicase/endonuclease Cas3 n=1 Tax=Caldicellulosiruptor morganii TaxID=1387555 RepID=A0ABY7BPC0_9FIRM|nr:CRISPR-associated helicase/endonuclease Cas3 [Caldicellulosiruptor morganii]WAM33737.1 CRISPR-associated helicase/endonuclease Cas3 [Caldicellulosiruptor morganii]
MSEIWAKSSYDDINKQTITLSKHVSDVLEVFKNIEIKIKNKSLIDATKIAIYLHDLGKVLPSFQIKVLKNKMYQPWDICYEVPHSLFSIFWIDINKLKEKLNGEDYLNFVISAVAYHHWRERFDDFISKENEMLKKLCKLIIDKWGEHLQNNLDNEYEKISNHGEYKDLITLNRKWLNSIINGRILLDLAIPPYKFDYEPLRREVNKEWILVAGFLQRCDHYASWCEEEGKEEELDKVEIDPMNKNAIDSSILTKVGESAWQFVALNNKLDKNIILIAPTGYGKTEFAFLWSNGEKFFYTLPIRSAVNNTYERAKGIFGDDKTGVLHSDIDLYLLNKASDEADVMKIYELAKQLSYPAIISTGDQFFPYALRPPGFEKLFATLSYSRLVIDEIQAYDPKACAIITKFIEMLYKIGGKFLLMTATMPKFIEHRIRELIPSFNDQVEEVNIYKKEKRHLEKIYKHKLRLELIKSKTDSTADFRLPEEKIDEILEQAKRGKRVLVILNTVAFAQEVYKKLKEKASGEIRNNIFLLHSRFTLNDKEIKEREYIKSFYNPKSVHENVGKILVSTQVVEASLDIDADVLFTEICPLDALVQRMGRVLRRYFYRNGKVINKSNNDEHELSEMFKAFEKEPSGEPNVHVFIFDDKLQSGGDLVYPKELVKLSLAWLWKESQKNNLDTLLNEVSQFKEDDIDYDKKIEEKIFQQEFLDLLENISQKSGKKKNKKNQESNVYDTIVENNDWLSKIDKTEIELSEYEKYVLVSLFYSTLKQNGTYLRSYYDTLDILEAGWMSEKKSEAEKIFRNIFSLQVVPEEYLEKFEADILNFISKEEATPSEKKLLFTRFKKDVLAKYVVNQPFERGLTPVIKRLNLKFNNNNWEIRLQRWLSDIYVSSHKYNEELGLLKNERYDIENYIV